MKELNPMISFEKIIPPHKRDKEKSLGLVGNGLCYNDVKRIAVIAPGNLPIPSVLDGAIETLTTFLIQQNEIEGKVAFTVFSPYHEKAESVASQYKNTKFKFFRRNILVSKVYNLFFRLLRIVSDNKTPICSYFIYWCIRFLKTQLFDAVLVEGNYNQVLQLKMSSKTPIILHMHTDILNIHTPMAIAIISACDQIWAVSGFLKKQISQVDEFQKDKIKVFRNTVNPALFCKDCYEDFREEYRKKWKISPQEQVIMFCGRIDPSKGVKELLLAFLKLKNPSKLMIVGASWFHESVKTEYMKELIELSKRANDRIFFTGYIPHEEVPPFFAAADILVCPSLCNEAAGLVILESIASGNPVIATQKGGIPEYANEAVGILLEVDEHFVDRLADAMTVLLEDHLLYDQKQQACSLVAKEYGPDKYYSRFLELLIG